MITPGRYTIVDSDEGILVLDIAYDFAGLPGLTGNQASFGGALDRLAGLAGPGLLGIESLRFAVYGTYGTSTGFYSNFLLGYGDHDFDQSRSVGGIPGIAGSRSADTDASSFQAMLTVGYTMGDDTFSHGPFAGLEYQRVNVDGYTDRGSLVNLAVDEYDVDSLRGLIGYRVDARYGKFRPYASVAYAHEFEDGENRTTASFAGADFRLSGGELQSALLLNAGTGISLSDSLTLDIGYRGEISIENEGLDSHGGTVGLGYRF